MTKRTLWLVVPWAAFAALAIGWVIYWFVLAGGAEARVRAWIAEQNAQGAHASVGRIVRHGFPVLLRLELRDTSYVAARGGWRLATTRADLHVDMLNPSHVIFQAKAPIAVTRENGDVSNITADALIASLRTRRDRLAQAGVEADNLVLDDPAKEGVLHVQKLVLNVRPDARAADQYQVAFDANAMTLPRPVRTFEAFGLEVQSMRAAIVVEHGAALLETSPDDPLAPWRAAGGRLRFEALALHWGPLEATGSGAGGLDDRRRLSGSLAFPIAHPGPVFAAMANGPGLDPDLRRALSLLSAGYMLSGDDITLDVNAAAGVLKLEGIPMRELPPVY